MLSRASRAELWACGNEAARGLGNRVGAVFGQAGCMNKDSYGNLAFGEGVEDALQGVEKLAGSVEETLLPEGG
jgi:hypothetical protein